MTVKEATKETFDQEVLKAEGKVLVDFNADWCGPCQMLKPIIEEFAESNPEVKIVSVNIDDEEELAEQYEVSSIPCLVLFADGEEVKRNVGVLSKKKIERMLGE